MTALQTAPNRALIEFVLSRLRLQLVPGRNQRNAAKFGTLFARPAWDSNSPSWKFPSRCEQGRQLTALGEIMVLSGGRNVAIGATVDAESFTSLPDRSGENLVDGQTDLGLPIGPAQSASNGFLSIAQPVPAAQKWVQLDLGRPV